MAKCKNCKHMTYQKVVFNYATTEYPYCPAVEECLDDIEKEIVCSGFEGITNADRIRCMTYEELAWFLCKVKADYQWIDQEFPREDEGGEWEEWLKSEVGCE